MNSLAADPKTKYYKSYPNILVSNTPEQFLKVTPSSVPNDRLPAAFCLVGSVPFLLKRRKSLKR